MTEAVPSSAGEKTVDLPIWTRPGGIFFEKKKKIGRVPCKYLLNQNGFMDENWEMIAMLFY